MENPLELCRDARVLPYDEWETLRDSIDFLAYRANGRLEKLGDGVDVVKLDGLHFYTDRHSRCIVLVRFVTPIVGDEPIIEAVAFRGAKTI
ncbi:MAG: hypothetical protein ACP5MH_10490 [Thermoproteus sp.]